MYLFDTDALSQATKPEPPRQFTSRLDSIPPALQFTTSITLGELIYGAHKSSRGESLLAYIEEHVFDAITILPFDSDAAVLYGEIRSDLERHGLTLDEPDLRIAAIAVARDLTLVTGNVRHFDRIPGLRVENWLA